MKTFSSGDNNNIEVGGPAIHQTPGNLNPDTFQMLVMLAMMLQKHPEAAWHLALVLTLWLALNEIDNHLRRPPSGLAIA